MDLFKNVNLKLLKHGANHYTSIINNKQYMYAFFEQKNANRCINFLSEYKHKYGKWPTIDNYYINEFNEKTELQLIEPSKRDNISNIRQTISIEEYPIDFLQHVTKMTNIQIMAITEFDYSLYNSKIDISFKGGEFLMNDENYDKLNSQAIKEFTILSLNSLYYSGNDKNNYLINELTDNNENNENNENSEFNEFE